MSGPPHDGYVITKFTEFRGVYEYHKTQALVKHLRTLAEVVSRAHTVRICSQAPERPWISVQEWVEPGGTRVGQWQSDVEIVALP